MIVFGDIILNLMIELALSEQSNLTSLATKVPSIVSIALLYAGSERHHLATEDGFPLTTKEVSLCCLGAYTFL